MAVKIVVDSTLNVPASMRDELGIILAPTTVFWEGQEYEDGIDITHEGFCERYASASGYATTSGVNPLVFRRIFERELEQGNDVLAMVPSSKVTRTPASAQEAAQGLDDSRLVVIDTQTTGMAGGWLAVLAARAAQMGAGLKDCEAAARTAIREKRTSFFGVLESTDGMKRAGRLGTAQHFVASTLKIRPILEAKDGEVSGVERHRSRSRALARLSELLEERVAGRSPLYLAVQHVCAPDEAQMLLDQAIARCSPAETLIEPMCPTVAVHYGPGAVGYMFVVGDFLT